MTNLSNTTLSLWGKKNINEDSEEVWLPLIAHLIDTKNVIGWLYNHWLNDGQRRILSQGFENSNEVQNLVEFIGYIHDIGKATPAFQIKQSFIHNEDLDQDLLERLLQNGFDNLEELKANMDTRHWLHALAGEVILENSGLNESIGAIVGGHHGKPQNKYFDYEDQLMDDTSKYYQSDSWAENPTREKWENVQKEIINYGLDLCNFKNLEDIPTVTDSQAVILEGLVIMADWLASSEYTIKDGKRVSMFPLISMDQGFSDIDMTSRYQQGILNWLKTDSWTPQLIVDTKEQYQKRWNFDPRQVQEQMSQAIGDSVDPSMIIVEAPMGIGKTEIALTAVEQLAAKTGINGLFFGLPTQATANAMFDRVDNWLGNIAKEQSENLSIKLMHGKAQFNQKYHNIPDADDIETDEGAVVVNQWFNGKKSILTDFVIGTIDQLLLMGLKQKHLALRHLGLSGKIVVIDEVHAYDVYMSSYLEKAIEWLGAYHVPVVALSATLPVDKRNELLTAYCRGKYGSEKFKAQNTNWQTCQAYPLLSILDGKILKQKSDFSTQADDTTVKVTRLSIENYDLIEKINDQIEDGGVAGVIVNTVKRAQELAKIAEKECSEDTQILVLHSAFLANDRSNLESKLEKSIGNHQKRPKKMIVIGTQVLEQSLDIDFDVMYTDIAPIDLILQRAGRLHRHQVKRPDKLIEPQLFIMGINSNGDYGDANQAIYEKYLLIKTDHFLKDNIKLPSDISNLVQKVYSADTDNEVQDLQEAEVKKFNIDQEKAEQKSKGYQIRAPRVEKTLHGWLDNDSDTDLNDVKAEAAVRDTNETIEVLLLKKDADGFYLMDGRKVDEEVPDSVVAQQLIRLPHALTMDINQSIRNLERDTISNFPEWQNSSWLKGSVALILDANNETEFNGYKIKYSSDLGLSYEK